MAPSPVSNANPKCDHAVPSLRAGSSETSLFDDLNFSLTSTSSESYHDEWSTLERHWHVIRGFFPSFRCQEEEDEATGAYCDMLGARPREVLEVPLPTSPTTVAGDDELMSTLPSTILPEWEYVKGDGTADREGYQRYRMTRDPCALDDAIPHDREIKVPFLDQTRDKYEIATWKWMSFRWHYESEEIAKRGIAVFVNVLLQVVCIGIIWGIGSTEEVDGRFEIVVASFTTGITGISSCIFGILGALAENELFLRGFWIGQLWMLSVMVAFLYIEAHNLLEREDQCSPINVAYSAETEVACSKSTDPIKIALTLCVIEFFLGFAGVYSATAMLDSLNDRTALEDNIAVFKYFQYYCNELLKKSQAEEHEASTA